jgi:hypothetical protein
MHENFLVYETMCFSVLYSDTSVVPPLIYAVMVIGPVAMDSLLLVSETNIISHPPPHVPHKPQSQSEDQHQSWSISSPQRLH